MGILSSLSLFLLRGSEEADFEEDVMSMIEDTLYQSWFTADQADGVGRTGEASGSTKWGYWSKLQDDLWGVLTDDFTWLQ